ncbi:flagellin [Paenibacillus sp. AR247]|uniref:flagellin N-terminal helical domain-containing protein n=1 Tax=Paenibacillus sp. AR247 TaxID=1631599 RepID=UPI000CFA5C9C|nr:flagellin [Paenibacillus sp. AR247]PQP87304.1 flagellin [Paenibacillus sp. AR247]
MIINHNIAALNTHRQLSINTANTNKNIEKLSSGLRINRAGDDAAGLAISEKMRGQIRGLDQASRNAQDGISLIQTAEGALNETHSILQRMREISNQSANGTNTDTDRNALQDEMNQLTSEINRIGNTTEFNTQKLLNGGIASQDGAKITKATSATVTGAAIAAGPISIADGAKITVDGQTFNVGALTIGSDDANGDGTADDDTTATANAKELAAKLGQLTSGGTKLSDLVDIKVDANDQLVFTAKSTGKTSEVIISGTALETAKLGFTTDPTTTPPTVIKGNGNPSTVERAGLQAAGAITGQTTIGANDSLKFTVGSDSAVEVKLNDGTTPKVYDTANADKNVAQAAMNDLVKDLNAALQKAGLDGKVTASLSKDNEIQFISETGKDISVANGTGTALTALGFDGTETIGNVDQVVGPGAQGSGFSTKFQIGANTGQSMSLTIDDMRSAALGITGNAGQAGFTKENSVTNGTNDVKTEAALNISTAEDASKAIAVLDKATQTVSSARSKLGAVQNRLEHTINNLGTASENLTAAESRIRDVDMAKEMMEQTKNNILAQAAQAMLAQANQQPQGVLQLLR